jgi:hypothetical protein
LTLRRARSGGEDALRRAILNTLVYADLFDYPLSAAEIHRYLTGHAASRDAVVEALEVDPILRELVEATGPWYHLEGREHLADVRSERAAASERLWPVARRYGEIIARLPFVRLVAVSGALAVHNAVPRDDIDFFLLVEPQRLWLCRLFVLVVVRFAAARGHDLCPNYLLSTSRLALGERNLFTAHEAVQMVPLDGSPWYDAFLEANQWVRTFLPNALDSPQPSRKGARRELGSWPAQFGAALLGLPVFDPLERWEMERKVDRLSARARREGGSVTFSAEECRGHFAAHDQRILRTFHERIATYGDLLSDA